MESGEIVYCKICNSSHIVRNGRVKDIQTWKCQSCGVKFINNNASYGMKTPANLVRQAVQMYYEGLSLPTIQRQLHQNYHNFASVSTLYSWVHKLTKDAYTATQEYDPEIGDEWCAIETTFNVLNKKVRITDILDIKTRFLLLSQVSFDSSPSDLIRTIEQVANQFNKIPKVVVVSHSANQLKKHGLPFTIRYSTGEIESFLKTLRRRKKLLLNLKKFDKVTDIINGWLIYYNYYRQNEWLWGNTPSQVANVSHKHKNERRYRASMQ